MFSLFLQQKGGGRTWTIPPPHKIHSFTGESQGIFSPRNREYSIVRGKVVTSRFAQASLSCTVTIMSNTRVVERSHSACASFACFAVVPPRRTGFLSPLSYVAAVLGQPSRPAKKPPIELTLSLKPQVYRRMLPPISISSHKNGCATKEKRFFLT